MAYKLENFLVQVSGTDRLLKIKESSGIIKHTIDGFSITSLRAINNIVKIITKSSTIDLDFSTTGSKTVSSSFVFTKGTVYWLALQMNLTGASVTAIANSALMQIGNNGGNPITSWIQVNATFSSGAPTVAAPNSFQTQGAPLIRMTKL